jgi:hypothetical protein
VISVTRKLPSMALIHRVVDVALAYTLERMAVLERIPGNPIGIGYRRVAFAIALMARYLPSPGFNSVVGLRKGEAEHIQADSATTPCFRNRGLHAALLHQRIRDAQLAGADCVCGGATFLSQSHRNMERVGMRLLFLRAIWAMA